MTKTELIIDTKWKLLTGNEDENYGISQADMYQMYAYAHKFKCNDYNDEIKEMLPKQLKTKIQQA